MFKNLKAKIKEETGSDEIPVRPLKNPSISGRSLRHRESMSSQHSLDDLTLIEQKDAEISALKVQLSESQSKINELSEKVDKLNEEKISLEKANSLLEESLKVAQVQKEMLCDEQDKIQNCQSTEIAKLKSMLLFREQEAVYSLTQQKNSQSQIDNLKNELSRIKDIEPQFEDMKDELENLRHSTQIEKNSFVTQIAAKEEEIKHLKSKLEIISESRALVPSESDNEKVQLLLQERKLLQQSLEEAHLHLIDIKSNWSLQNLALETQLSRLSRQVAEETTEKRKVLEEREEFTEKIKKLQLELLKQGDELMQRDNKIKLLNEEIVELNTTLGDIRDENNEEIEFLRTKVSEQSTELDQLKEQIQDSDDKLSESFEDHEFLVKKLQVDCENLERANKELRGKLESEKQENMELQLKNAEISQSLENLRRELRDEKDDVSELNERIKTLEIELSKRLININELNDKIAELTDSNQSNSELLAQIDRLSHEVADKNKGIKILNQRLFDMKKTLHEEIKNSNSGSTGSMDQHGPAILTPTNYNDNNSYNHPSLHNNRKFHNNIAGPVIMDEIGFHSTCFAEDSISLSDPASSTSVPMSSASDPYSVSSESSANTSTKSKSSFKKRLKRISKSTSSLTLRTMSFMC